MPLALPKRHDTESTDFVVPDEDYYTMGLVKYDDPVQSKFEDYNGEYPMRVRLVFEITDEESEFDGAEVSGWFDMEMNAGRKRSLIHVLTALRGGEEIGEDEELDLDDFIGLRCRGRIEHSKKPSKTDPSKINTYANVVETKAIKKTKTKTAKDKTPFDE